MEMLQLSCSLYLNVLPATHPSTPGSCCHPVIPEMGEVAAVNFQKVKSEVIEEICSIYVQWQGNCLAAYAVASCTASALNVTLLLLLLLHWCALCLAGFLAPLLEETLFRGFLLTSLTKVMPTWAAVIASAAAFGIAHLSIKDLPILFALGCWLGAIYCRSKNLLTPMIVHGAWNGTVLTLLFWLTANGVNVQQLLKDGSF